VVVIGYGTARKKDLTGAVSTINARDINGLPVAGSDQIMQGKAAGVAVTQVTGAPGDGVSVIIRGQASFLSSVPLYVIDGIPTADGINEISPNDIESISVLKDASSASIYGARAANGVVLITTKKGRTANQGCSECLYRCADAGHLIPMANTAEYLNAYNAAATNDYVAGGPSNRAPLPLGMLDTCQM
jgi:TonB-dependent SusC/RagA subfamily outer membrane receptor